MSNLTGGVPKLSSYSINGMLKFGDRSNFSHHFDTMSRDKKEEAVLIVLKHIKVSDLWKKRLDTLWLVTLEDT